MVLAQTRNPADQMRMARRNVDLARLNAISAEQFAQGDLEFKLGMGGMTF